MYNSMNSNLIEALLSVIGDYIIVAIVALLINIFICNIFAECAENKGYSRSKYFWVCFFFGVIGYAYVAALTDKDLLYRISQLEHQFETSNGYWICDNCKTQNSTNYSQCKKCGSFRG